MLSHTPPMWKLSGRLKTHVQPLSDKNFFSSEWSESCGLTQAPIMLVLRSEQICLIVPIVARKLRHAFIKLDVFKFSMTSMRATRMFRRVNNIAQRFLLDTLLLARRALNIHEPKRSTATLINGGSVVSRFFGRSAIFCSCLQNCAKRHKKQRRHTHKHCVSLFLVAFSRIIVVINYQLAQHSVNFCSCGWLLSLMHKVHLSMMDMMHSLPAIIHKPADLFLLWNVCLNVVLVHSSNVWEAYVVKWCRPEIMKECFLFSGRLVLRKRPPMLRRSFSSRSGFSLQSWLLFEAGLLFSRMLTLQETILA